MTFDEELQNHYDNQTETFTHVVVGQGYWGAGNTREEAFKNWSGNKESWHMLFHWEVPSKVAVGSMGQLWLETGQDELHQEEFNME